VRICHILPTVMRDDGPSNVLFELVDALRSKGISSTVISLRRPPSDRDPESILTDAGARYIGLQMRQRLWDPGAWMRLARSIRIARPEIVQCNLIRANVYGTLAAQLCKSTHVVCVAHNVERYMVSGDRLSRIARQIERQTAKMASAYVAVSEAVAAALREKLRVSRQIVVIPNGLREGATPLERTAARRRLGLRDKSFVVGTVGRLHPQKGHAILLQAAAKLRETISDFQVVIIGDGPERGQLERFASNEGLNGIVHFAGTRRDVTDVLSAIDLFVMTSYYEGLPVALLEAMRCAIPCVVTRVGGMPEVVVDGKTGFIVEPDDAESFAARIRAFENDPSLVREMGAAAEKRFRARYTSQIMADRYGALYQAILSGDGKAEASEEQA
jgi:glycosyltransferase involved in cell wall biosynthesis